MTLTPEEINRILTALQESEWDEAVVEIGEVRIAVARNGGSVALTDSTAALTDSTARTSASTSESKLATSQVAAPEPRSAPPAPVIGEGTLVSAPSVGIFWRSPEPGAPPFVEVGTEVNKGDVLCIVEVMKLMMNVTATASGVISGIHTQNGDAVEFGTPLFSISEK